MPFDALATACVTDELNSALAGGRVQKIVQPSDHAVALQIYAGRHRHWLLASADAKFARIHLSNEPFSKGFAEPGPFLMLLRKHLEGGFTRAIAQAPRERVLHLEIESKVGSYRLVVEVMARHSNVILVDAVEMVLGALKVVPPAKSRIRPILPGRPFHPVPKQGRDGKLFPPGDRIDPLTHASEFWSMLTQADPNTPLRDALLGVVPGCSPFLADQLAWRASRGQPGALGELNREALEEALQSVYGLFESRDWHPAAFQVPTRSSPDFAPYVPVGLEVLDEATSLSALIDRTWSGQESRSGLATTSKDVLRDIDRALEAVRGKLASLKRGLEASLGAQALMEEGQLLLSFGHAATPGETSLAIPDLGMELEVDSTLTIAENAERRFRRYRKLRDAGKKLPAMISAAELEQARLEDLRRFAEMAESEGDLKELRRELEGTRPAGKRRRMPEKRRRAPQYSLDGDVTVLLGRNARENEEVTFGLAKPDDLWFHARGRTGTHLVLRKGSQGATQEEIAKAAALAAYYSEGRTDTKVDVDYVAVRHVRKAKGSAPGRVTYRGEQTVTVEPSTAGWKRQTG